MKKFVFIFSLLCCSQLMAAQPVQVVASIRPLQLIVDALLVDVGDSQVLLPVGSSPHHFALKPSQLRLLHQADLVIWVGPQLESFLQRTLSLNANAQLSWLDEAASGTPDHGHDTEHLHLGEDPHLWLDPEQTIEFAGRLRLKLEQLRPEAAGQLLQNYQAFITAVRAVDQTNRQLLEPVRQVGFVVFHDAFSRFVQHYQLHQVAYFTLEPGLPPGARKIGEIRRLLRDGGVQCLFTEPQFDPLLMQRTREGLDVRQGVIDPLASDIPSAQGYPQFLQKLAESIHGCLAGEY